MTQDVLAAAASFTACPFLICSLPLNIVSALYWGIAQAAVNIVYDLYIFVLPLPIIYRLNLTTKRKIQVMALFFIALLGVIASIISLAYRVISIQGPAPDLTFAAGVLMICNLSEMTAASIVCAAPAFASFLRIHVLGSGIVRGLKTSLNLGIFYNFRSTWGMSQSEHVSKTDATGRNGQHLEDPIQVRRGGLGNLNGYIEMSDTWLFNRGNTTVDIEAPSVEGK
ncbi:hypothetical protein S7711_10986 [Stachybotrys chartarum IBT 7711]|uniref:Rhodopsin domain-containing protein n=1 Tax=Stachybotrys chartarum (strain CBS 109288 / IBT 7711) TaxID=1280523 RepID=A0A084AM43_STACB|nr:hypothetical protein S7711_10986 [Stachybotrys chartarum IBT 7711]KFA56274.1 hypothetical protein S40293_10344 [Stachybotrys chartarum IBT 40293]